ncbi:MAG: nucleotidyltransferase [Verrucomicrobiota bacterium]
MNVFFEFHKVVKALQDRKVGYAVIGGVAMAFHSYARFTKDIDLLTKESELDAIAEVLDKEGYKSSGEPWTFKSLLTLHRFWKIEDGDEMVVDILVSGCERHDRIIDEALEAYSKHTGRVFVAKREDLIWMKEQRNSPLDKADIEILKDGIDE